MRQTVQPTVAPHPNRCASTRRRWLNRRAAGRASLLHRGRGRLHVSCSGCRGRRHSRCPPLLHRRRCCQPLSAARTTAATAVRVWVEGRAHTTPQPHPPQPVPPTTPPLRGTTPTTPQPPHPYTRTPPPRGPQQPTLPLRATAGHSPPLRTARLPLHSPTPPAPPARARTGVACTTG